MAFTSLGTRLAGLPLVLAGPVLRRVTGQDVTVFLALKEGRKLTLEIFRSELNGTGLNRIQVGTRSTARLGDHLHVACVTAKGDSLQAGTRYFYNVRFGAPGNDGSEVPSGSPGLLTADVMAGSSNAARDALLYATGPGLPSFVVPPADVGGLRILHASCRKPHGEGLDAFPVVDDLIAAQAADVAARPHQLFLTGDQIYADDVAHGLLHMVIDAGDTLFGAVRERLPVKAGDKRGNELAAGTRAAVVGADDAGLTSGEADSHLMTFAEFCAMYLFAWSETLWPVDPPSFADVHPSEAAAWKTDVDNDVEAPRHNAERLRFIAETDHVARFRAGLPQVRRLLANVPSYMQFDDHEITDDWNLNLAWMKRVLDPAAANARLGRAIIRNGLAAYAVFQAWGNVPEQFAAGAGGVAGRDLLGALDAWDGAPTGAAVDRIVARVGLPTGFTAVAAVLPEERLRFYYAITWAAHQVIVLDTRTERRTVGADHDPPALLLSDDSFDRQIRNVPVPAADSLVLLVAPGPIFGVPLHEFVAEVGRRPFFDPEHWSLQPRAREKLLAALLTRPAPQAGTIRARVVVLSGDVHHGSAVHVRYHADKAFRYGQKAEGVLAQLTSSALKNQELKTKILHGYGFGLIKSVPLVEVSGWANVGGARRNVGTEWAFGQQGAALIHEEPGLFSHTYGVQPGGTPPQSAYTLTTAPEWRYEVRPALGEGDRIGGPPLTRIDVYDPDRGAALQAYLDSARNQDLYRDRYGSGKEVVGLNNLGDVTFVWNPGDDKAVVQDLWWRLPGQSAAAPLTRFRLALANGSVAAVGSVRYGDRDLRRGDHDRDAGGNAVWAATEQAVPANAPGHVAALQRDLVELGFAMVGPADGGFGAGTEWAVREFQAYAGLPQAAGLPQGPGVGIDDHLAVPIPPADRYTDPITGVVDRRTRDVIGVWIDRSWRCPVVVRAEQAGVITDNVWRAGDGGGAGTVYRVRDLSGAYPLPLDRAETAFHPLARWATFGGFSGGQTAIPAFGGPTAAATRQVWAQAELLPAAVDEGATERTLSASRRSTFKVVRAVAEVECGGFLDGQNAYDAAYLSGGTYHWTVAIAQGGNPPLAGELNALFAFARYARPAAYRDAIERFGIRPDRDWTAANGQPSGERMLKRDWKYVCWLERAGLGGGWAGIPLISDEAERFRGWHWFHRLAMAARSYPEWRRMLYDFARLRLRDLAVLPWGGTGQGDFFMLDLPDGSSRPVRLGDVFTSERSWAAISRAHVNAPGRVVQQSRASNALHAAVATALGGVGIPPPDTWTDAQEQAVLDEWISNLGDPNGFLRVSTEQARNWPAWRGNQRGFTLDLTALAPAVPMPVGALPAIPAAGGLLQTTRHSFLFDTAGLPPAPDYSAAT